MPGCIGVRKVAAVAEAAGIGLYGGCLLESSVGAAAHLQVFATFRELAWGCEHFGPQILTEEFVTEPLRFEDFHVHLPTGPGIGVVARRGQAAPLRARAEGTIMLYHVRMDVRPPHDIDPERFERLKAEEKAQAQELQRSGKWRHLWRIAGHYSNISVFDVETTTSCTRFCPPCRCFPSWRSR